jgi:hypothetical protein
VADHEQGHHDELWGALRQRLVDEGLSPERAEALATALVDPDARPGALDELAGRHDRLRDLLDRLPPVPDPARALEHEVEHLRDVAEKGETPRPRRS